MGKVLEHVFAVMAPPLALAADPDAALMRLERVATRWASDDAPADALGRPRRARRLAPPCGELVRHGPARGRAQHVLRARRGRRARGESHAALVAAVARYASRELVPQETGVALSAWPSAWCARRSRRPNPTCPSR